MTRNYEGVGFGVFSLKQYVPQSCRTAEYTGKEGPEVHVGRTDCKSRKEGERPKKRCWRQSDHICVDKIFHHTQQTSPSTLFFDTHTHTHTHTNKKDEHDGLLITRTSFTIVLEKRFYPQSSLSFQWNPTKAQHL